MTTSLRLLSCVQRWPLLARVSLPGRGRGTKAAAERRTPVVGVIPHQRRYSKSATNRSADGDRPESSSVCGWLDLVGECLRRNRCIVVDDATCPVLTPRRIDVACLPIISGYAISLGSSRGLRIICDRRVVVARCSPLVVRPAISGPRLPLGTPGLSGHQRDSRRRSAHRSRDRCRRSLRLSMVASIAASRCVSPTPRERAVAPQRVLVVLPGA